MNITKENIDALNAVVKVDITAEDYQEKVASVLKDYRKKANIPGFRPGQVPMGLVKKQYGKSVMVDEVNKLLQESLNNFLAEEKLDVLGNPLPKLEENFDWDAENFSFEFELGLAPEINVDLSAGKITKYNIVANDELIDKEVENLQNRFGNVISQEEVAENSTIKGVFVNEEKEIEAVATLVLEDIKGKLNTKKFVGSKVGDVLELKTKNLFNEDLKLATSLGLKLEEVEGLEIPVTFKIDEISYTEPADLDQELFDKIFGEGVVSTAAELRQKIKEDAEGQFVQQADQYLLNAITENLIENTSFDLPKEFLIKWLERAGDKPLTEEEAAAEYDKSEKGLRYQLIEGKIMADNDVKVDFQELKDYAIGFIRQQMAQYGQMNPEDQELEDIAMRVLQNQDEAKRLQSQLISSKMLDLFKEKVSFDEKEVTYEDFVKEVYK
ncbi:trigger factor [Wenyingzhuangia sp. 2_MG-2023]|uniref:trigger factor n=1 Tax=Wenyingzhuangia sp. 2_MG-2023 TaxID=3062639 RepID=UPI0026E2EF78|nr:trigger factor [Wenyingzhuangia sp. 2_MG-2023]MDO6736427.1 trigger factor [Wenyingzhuangia sp. 2_MG-2023]